LGLREERKLRPRRILEEQLPIGLMGSLEALIGLQGERTMGFALPFLETRNTLFMEWLLSLWGCEFIVKQTSSQGSRFVNCQRRIAQALWHKIWKINTIHPLSPTGAILAKINARYTT
jgi:hypothetical protein